MTNAGANKHFWQALLCRAKTNEIPQKPWYYYRDVYQHKSIQANVVVTGPALGNSYWLGSAEPRVN